ncbi:hypothetical protein FE782_11860 [Paenibacillus antri]|uniref:CBM-cenC domain-containing protein n=1 Tax=Paenibacillus antri TaxID=2582848 RepID=A0A5R9G6P2_9BACL|nr:carbohydrate binding domain-containing protein [Paenibacillus antri]TLS52057.1 hypothetical protein FE782_11860 [Paenibacillus antri]
MIRSIRSALHRYGVISLCLSLVFSGFGFAAGGGLAAAEEAGESGAAVAASAVAASTAAALANPGFEEPAAENGAAPGWTQIFGMGGAGSVTVTQDAYAAGAQSMKLADPTSLEAVGVISDAVAVTPGHKVTVSALVSGEGGGTAELYLRFFSATGALLANLNERVPTPGAAWQRVALTAQVPAGATTGAALLYSSKGNAGTYYFDELTWTSEAPANRFLANAGFEAPPTATGAIPGWTVKSGSAAVSQAQAFEGGNSLYVSNVANTGSGINLESDLIDVEEGATYSLTSNVFLQQGAFQGFYVYVYDEAGRLVKAADGKDFHLYVATLSPVGEWVLASGQFTVQPGGKKAKVSVISGNRRGYQFYLDDVSILKAVENGGFEAEAAEGGAAVPGWRKFAATDGDTFGVSTERFASGARSLVIENEPGKYLNVIGNLIPVEPGATYTAAAKTFIEYGSTGMYVRYFDANGAYLGKQNWSILSEPSMTWFTNYVRADVPQDAAYAAVMFAGSNRTTYKYYIDDVALTKGLHIVEEEPIPENSIVNVGVDLGVQIRKATVMRGDIGKFGDGRDVIYTVVQGAPSVFTAIDIDTEEVVYSEQLPDTSGAWSVKVSGDGTVYLGAFNLGLLYRYFPATGEMKNLGHPLPTKDSVLYPMDAGPDGKMYGGNYPSGSVYEYDPATNAFTDFGTMSYRDSGERWVRVTVYDEENHKIYAGVGNQARLVEYDIATKTKRDLLPAKYADITSVYDLDLVDGKLFVKKEANDAYEMFVLDAATGEQIVMTNGDSGERVDEVINYSRGVSPKSPIDDKLYFAGAAGALFEYDLSTDAFRSLGVSIDGAAIGYGYVQLDEPGFPGYSLVGLSGNGGKMFKYNLETGNVKVTDVMLPAEPVDIHSIVKGPDGNIYTSGYLAGNLGMYDPGSGASKYFNGIGQGEAMASVGGKLYIGAYPDAKIYEYDLAKPWNRDNPDLLNPRLAFDLNARPNIPGYTFQDRPFGMAGSEERGELYVGTVPENGLLGGALAVYDVDGGGEPDVYFDLVPDQSILSLVYQDGMLYGGTSIHGGQGGTPTASEAVLFAFDPATKRKTFEIVPVPGKTSITALHAGPDGNVWGLANGTLFIFDPATQQVVYSHDAFPAASGRWIDGAFETGTDGNVYGTVDGKFFKVDAATMEVTALATQARKLAQDDFGNFYLYTPSGTNLYRYTIPELLVGLSGAKLETEETFVRVGERMPFSIIGLLEKGRATRNLSGATIEYAFSKPNHARVEADGTVTALQPGNQRVSVRVTLGGVTVESNEVNLVVSNASEQADPNVPSAPGQ